MARLEIVHSEAGNMAKSIHPTETPSSAIAKRMQD
jgi:hypothetical protein